MTNQTQTTNQSPRKGNVADAGCWIRNEKRLAIYLRDGLACAYCGASVEAGANLSLDHLKPCSKGGSNHETNLVTACERCNKSRGNRSVRGFCEAVAIYLNHGISASEIERHVRKCSRRVLNMSEAKEMVARRGSAAKVLAAIQMEARANG